jgi:hypothetical protein
MTERDDELEEAYRAMPAALRDLATRLFKEIALTAEPSKSQLEATLIEFIGQTLFMVDRWKTERPQ